MSRDRWDFVLCVLDALKAGGELVIDGRQVFRVDVGQANGRELAHECAQAAELLRKHRIGVYESADALALRTAIGDQTVRLENAINGLTLAIEKRKGRKR